MKCLGCRLLRLEVLFSRLEDINYQIELEKQQAEKELTKLKEHFNRTVRVKIDWEDIEKKIKNIRNNSQIYSKKSETLRETILGVCSFVKSLSENDLKILEVDEDAEIPKLILNLNHLIISKWKKYINTEEEHLNSELTIAVEKLETLSETIQGFEKFGQYLKMILNG